MHVTQLSLIVQTALTKTFLETGSVRPAIYCKFQRHLNGTAMVHVTASLMHHGTSNIIIQLKTSQGVRM